MFVYELDDIQSVVAGAGLKDNWVREGLSVQSLPTHYGSLSYSIAPVVNGKVRMEVSGSINASKTPVLVPVSLISTPLKSAVVNGTAAASKNGYIVVDALPAIIELSY